MQPAPNDAERNKASTVMRRIGSDLVKQSKASHEDNKSSRRKDVLSLLVQANNKEDLPGRMSDEDVLDRVYKLILNQSIYLTLLIEIPTFIVAGHETTRYAHLYLKCKKLRYSKPWT